MGGDSEQRGLRIGGVPVATPWSSLIGVLLLAWLFAPAFRGVQGGGTATAVVAVVFALLVYVTILGHELAHAGVARHFGYPVTRIELHLLGGWTSYERGKSAPGRELLIALAGPAATLAMAAGLVLAARGLDVVAPDAEVVLAVVRRLAAVCIVIGIYNLLPGLPLDGGALVKSTVWKATGSEARGTFAGGAAGLVVAAGAMALPFLLAAADGGGAPDSGSVMVAAVFSAWVGFGAWQALGRARLELRLEGLTAGELARPMVVLPVVATVADAVRLGSGAPAAAVVVLDPTGRLVGEVAPHAAAAVPPDRAAEVPVASVSRSIPADDPVPAGLTGPDLLARLAHSPAGEHLVVGPGGSLLGLLRTDDVVAALQGPARGGASAAPAARG